MLVSHQRSGCEHSRDESCIKKNVCLLNTSVMPLREVWTCKEVSVVVFDTRSAVPFLRSLFCVPFVVPLMEIIHCFLVLTLSNVRMQVNLTSIFCLRLLLSRKSYFILRVPLHWKLTCLHCVFVLASECNSLLKVLARRLLYAVCLLQCCAVLFLLSLIAYSLLHAFICYSFLVA